MSSTGKTKKRRAVAELVGFVAFALISKQMTDSFLGAYSGPATLITTLILLTIYMHKQGEKWASMGLRALPGAKAKLLLLPQAFLIFVVVLATIVLLTKGLESIGLHFMSETPEGEMERWGDIEGNLQQYLILIALSWIGSLLPDYKLCSTAPSWHQHLLSCLPRSYSDMCISITRV